MAPFIAETVSSAGAMNAAYGTCPPWEVCTSPISEPSPMPIDAR